ncbi:MAG: glycine oxidase ThiO [Gammaproteobacteria bacterium]|nr:glycine oxidase ThiO [Gammaproteobacteria bacterium]
MNSIPAQAADVIVIGGGIIGLLTARMLAREGVRVTVIDAGRIGNQSSWAGGGILSPLCPWHTPEPITALCRLSQQMYPRLMASLHEETGVDPEWTRTGLVFVDCTETAQAIAWCEREAVEVHRTSPDALGTLEPWLSHPAGESLWLPSIAQVRNPRLLRSLRASLAQLGVALVEDQPVIAFETDSGRVTAVRTESGLHAADRFVVAAGAWTAKLLNGLTPALPIAPVKGQMLAYGTAPGLLSRIVVRGDRYLIPRRDGVILAGSTVEASAGFDKTTTEAARAQLSAFAQELLPPLQDAAVLRHWAGLRPGTPTGIPYIDYHPTLQNLVLCAGHFRNGFVMAPASCHLLAELILNREPMLPPAPYRLDASH